MIPGRRAGAGRRPATELAPGLLELGTIDGERFQVPHGVRCGRRCRGRNVPGHEALGRAPVDGLALEAAGEPIEWAPTASDATRRRLASLEARGPTDGAPALADALAALADRAGDSAAARVDQLCVVSDFRRKDFVAADGLREALETAAAGAECQLVACAAEERQNLAVADLRLLPGARAAGVSLEPIREYVSHRPAEAVVPSELERADAVVVEWKPQALAESGDLVLAEADGALDPGAPLVARAIAREMLWVLPVDLREVLGDRAMDVRVKDDLFIQFVGGDPQVVLLGRLGNDPKRLFVINLPGRIVGTVDQHRLSFFVQGGFNSGKVKVEVGICRHNLEHAAVVVNIEAVFDKIRTEDNDLVAWIKQGLHDHVQAACRAAGHEHVACRYSRALLLRQAGGQGGANLRPAAVGHVGMAARLLVADQISQHTVINVQRAGCCFAAALATGNRMPRDTVAAVFDSAEQLAQSGKDLCMMG